MDEMLGTIYCWFDSLFGYSLAEYLWGYNCLLGDYSNPNLFNRYGMACIAITLFLVLLYYYVLNFERKKRVWWLALLCFSGVANFVIGTYATLSAYNAGSIGSCLMQQATDNGGVIQSIYPSDCWMFGVSNAIIALFLFFFFSLVLKWGSRTCKYYPF
jgi:uncharacterized BrkB/YihY/UPF0761 family membrane protein